MWAGVVVVLVVVAGGGGFTPPIQHLGQTWANYGKLEEIILIGIKS